MPHGLNDKEVIELICEIARLKTLVQILQKNNRFLQKIIKNRREYENNGERKGYTKTVMSDR